MPLVDSDAITAEIDTVTIGTHASPERDGRTQKTTTTLPPCNSILHPRLRFSVAEMTESLASGIPPSPMKTTVSCRQFRLLRSTKWDSRKNRSSTLSPPIKSSHFTFEQTGRTARLNQSQGRILETFDPWQTATMSLIFARSRPNQIYWPLQT